MTQDDLKGVVVKTVEFPLEFVEALFQYLDKLEKPFTEKEVYINTLREGFRIAQYKEYIRLEAEKAAKTAGVNDAKTPLRVVEDEEVVQE